MYLREKGQISFYLLIIILIIIAIFSIFLSNINKLENLNNKFYSKYNDKILESDKILNSAKNKTINETINGKFISEQDNNIGNHYVN